MVAKDFLEVYALYDFLKVFSFFLKLTSERVNSGESTTTKEMEHVQTTEMCQLQLRPARISIISNCGGWQSSSIAPGISIRLLRCMCSGDNPDSFSVVIHERKAIFIRGRGILTNCVHRSVSQSHAGSTWQSSCSCSCFFHLICQQCRRYP